MVASNRMKSVARLCCEENGSVLMECLVVLPIYFALLGGLFLIGEIVVNKMRVEIGDSVVTRLAADRMGLNAPLGDAMTYLFQEKFDGRGEYDVRQAHEEDDAAEVNFFATKYSGGVTLDLHLPDWIRGWLSLGNVMAEDSQRDRDENGGELKWAEVGENGDLTFFKSTANPFRAYVVHRMKPEDITSGNMVETMKTAYNRSRTTRDEVQDWDGVSAGEMIHRGILENVVRDGWLSYSPGDLSITVPNSGSVPNRVKRNLWMYGQ